MGQRTPRRPLHFHECVVTVVLFPLHFSLAALSEVRAMASASPEPAFIVWGIDQTPYGPVELPTLVSWVRDERVTAETWIFAARDRSWRKAVDMPELKRIFQDSNGAAARAPATLQGIDVSSLRRIKILAAMSD